MHFELHEQTLFMQAVIEDIVVKELTGLCGSCAHYEKCIYRKNSAKVIIQCEVFESLRGDHDQYQVTGMPEKGLCLNCSKNRCCHLPKAATGVWHCEEYE